MQSDAATTEKHPVRGAVWGLIAGIGLALLLIAYGVIALGTLTPYVVIVVVIALGAVFGSVGPAKSVGGPSEAPSP